MSYQIPSIVRCMQLRGVTKVPLSRFTPYEDVKIKHLITTMYIRGAISLDFQMKINVYFDSGGRSLLFSSLTVSNFDIVRIADYYCEIRFDFPSLQNLLVVGHQYYLEFELFGTYPMDEDNYLGLIIDHDSPLAMISETEVVKHSVFYEKE